MRRPSLFSTLFVLLLPVVADAQPRGLRPTDFYREVTIEDVALRPQGDLVAFTVMSIVEKDNTRHREIWLQPLQAGRANGDACRFTTQTEESASPSWSPDGMMLAFASKRGKDENTAWFARVNGTGGEAFPTTRFAAAVTSRSITNWESWYGTSDAQGLTEYEFGGPPWEQRDTYRRLSPISYVEHVTIPTLILHSENDYRTPIADGEQWFMALKKRKVPVEMVRYPRSTHDLSRTGEPWLLVDRLERIRSWFDYWLNQKPAPPSSPSTASGVAR